METKRFIGNDMSRLYDRVRQELGSEAVIIRTRTLARDGAEPLIELVAGHSEEESARLDLELQRSLLEGASARAGVEPARRRFTVEDLEAMLADVSPVVQPPRIQPAARDIVQPEWLEGFEGNAPRRSIPSFGLMPNVDEREEEIVRRRAQPLPRFEGPADDDGVWPLVQSLPRVNRATAQAGAAIREKLAAAGLFADAIEAVMRTARGSASAADALARALEAREIPFPAAEETAFITVLGPTGSGRTTALMKMALDCADSGREAILVAADSVRMGARDQVHAFGEAAGLQVLDAHSPADLPRLARTVEAGTCLFVDVPAGGLELAAGDGFGSFTYLALPAHWQAGAVEQALTAFEDQAFDACILTYADLAPNLAPALSLLLASPLGLAFVSDGRDVAAGMGEPDFTAIAAGLFVEGEKPYGALVASA